MAKEEIRYSDIYVQALANKVPCADSGVIHRSLKQVLFSAHGFSCFANESQQECLTVRNRCLLSLKPWS